MTNRSSTRHALFMSVISIMLCIAMLIGSTFAWFTDTAETAVNKIQAGTLKVDIQDANGDSIDGKTLKFEKAAGHESESTLWEPGVTYTLDSFKIVNEGNLALKYDVVVNGIDGDAKLNEAIEWTVKIGENENKSLADLNDTILPKDNNKDQSGETELITISGHMREDAGNAYQGLSIDGIGLTVLATQAPVEYDSYNNTYDANAPVYKATSTEEAQKILDTIDGYAIVELAAGDYDTLYLRQTLEASTRRTDLDVNISAYPAYYREFNGVTIKVAENADVTCDGVKAEAGLIVNHDHKLAGSAGFISYLSVKNITIEGIKFNNNQQTAIVLGDNSSKQENVKGSALYVNGFTVKNCKGTGSTTKVNNAWVNFFAAGSGSNDETFCEIENGVKGYNNITITGCEMTEYYQPICFNNATAVLTNLTVTNNTFTNCLDNHLMVSNKEIHGLITLSGNTLVNMEGRFIRLNNAQSDMVATIDNTTVTTPKKYDTGNDKSIAKFSGVEGFKVYSNGNGSWTVVDSGTTWIANGNTELLTSGT